MRPIKLFVIFFAAILLGKISYSQNNSVGTAGSLYQGIEFKMNEVKLPLIPSNSVSIVDFGAKSGGEMICTDAFSKAIESLAKKGGGRVVIPRGTWLTGPITLKSNIELYSEAGSLVVFSTDKNLYPLINTNFEGFKTYRCSSPINGLNLENIAITGRGVFDGSGDAWRAVKKEKLTESQWKKLVSSGGLLSENGKIWYPSEQFREGEKMAEMNVPKAIKTKEQFEKIRDFLRPVMMNIVGCKKVLIDGPTFQNSPAWCIHPLLCEDLTVRNTTVKNPWYSQNGDGIDIESCKNSVLYDSNFDCGDDAICIKSGKDKEGRDRGVPTENLIIKNCVVYHGHGGVTIGSEMSGGVRNMHVSNCTFLGTDVGLRFKSNRGRGGVVENIYISDIEMINIPAQAISFNLFYSGKSTAEELEAGSDGQQPKLLPVTEETPQFKNIYFRNINCKGAFQGIFLQGLPELNLENIQMENIRIEADYGLICSDTKGLKIKNLTILTTKSPVMDFKNAKNVEIDGVKTVPGLLPMVHLAGSVSENIVLKNAVITDPGKQIVVGKEVKSNALQLAK
ncbi:MAG: glycoside hydrolase family 28 protein [Prolixibacteraceae bacterium]